MIAVLKEILLRANEAFKAFLMCGDSKGGPDKRRLEELRERISLAARILVAEVKRETSDEERFERCRNVLCKFVAQLIIYVGEIDAHMRWRARWDSMLADEEDMKAEREFQEELTRVLYPPSPGRASARLANQQQQERGGGGGVLQGRVPTPRGGSEDPTDSQRFREHVNRQTSALQNVMQKLSESNHNNPTIKNSNNVNNNRRTTGESEGSGLGSYNPHAMALQYEQRVQKFTFIHLQGEKESGGEKGEEKQFSENDAVSSDESYDSRQRKRKGRSKRHSTPKDGEASTNKNRHKKKKKKQNNKKRKKKKQNVKRYAKGDQMEGKEGDSRKKNGNRDKRGEEEGDDAHAATQQQGVEGSIGVAAAEEEEYLQGDVAESPPTLKKKKQRGGEGGRGKKNRCTIM